MHHARVLIRQRHIRYVVAGSREWDGRPRLTDETGDVGSALSVRNLWRVACRMNSPLEKRCRRGGPSHIALTPTDHFRPPFLLPTVCASRLSTCPLSLFASTRRSTLTSRSSHRSAVAGPAVSSAGRLLPRLAPRLVARTTSKLCARSQRSPPFLSCSSLL